MIVIFSSIIAVFQLLLVIAENGTFAEIAILIVRYKWFTISMALLIIACVIITFLPLGTIIEH